MAQDGVVLLHGIFRTHRCMRRFARYLEQRGFRTLNLDYPSTRFPLEALVEVIHPQVASFAQTLSGKLHFAGYSMGGLLARAYIHQYRPSALGRVVLIGTPCGGSEIADLLQPLWLYRALYGPAGQQLVTDRGVMAHLFGKPDYELGVIAGNRTIDPVSSWIIGAPNDGKVSVASTCVDGMKAHRVIAATHTFFPDNREMWRYAERFLLQGHMEEEPATAST